MLINSRSLGPYKITAYLDNGTVHLGQPYLSFVDSAFVFLSNGVSTSRQAVVPENCPSVSLKSASFLHLDATHNAICAIVNSGSNNTIRVSFG